jgi:hypothetical protein
MAKNCSLALTECMTHLPLFEGPARDFKEAECLSLATLCFLAAKASESNKVL